MSSIGDVDLRREVGIGLIAKGTMMVLGFVGTVIFARVLGASHFGAFYLLVTLENFVDQPVTGTAQAAKKRLSEAGARPREIVGVQLGLYVSFVSVVAVAAWSLRGLVASYAGIEDAWLYFLLLVVTLTLFQMSNTMLGSTGKMGTVTWIDTLRSGFTLPFQVILVLLGYGVLGMVVGLAAATALTIPVVFYFIRVRPQIPSAETIRSVYSFARYSVLTSIINMGENRLGMILIGIGLTPAIAGYYEVAYKATMPAVFVAGLAGGGLMAKVSNADSRGDPVSDDVANVMEYGSILAIPIFFGVVAIPRKLVVTAYGEGFAAAASFLALFGVYRVIQTQTIPLGTTIRGLDRPDLELYFGGLAFAIIVVGSLAAIHYGYGGVGVLVVLIAAALVRYVSYLVLLRRRLDIPIVPDGFREQVASGAMMYVIVEGVTRLVPLPTVFHVAAVVGLGAGVYFASLYAISTGFRTMVQEVTPT